MFFFWSISQRNKQNDEWPKLTGALPSPAAFLAPLEAILDADLARGLAMIFCTSS
jgi:hypothetical protein